MRSVKSYAVLLALLSVPGLSSAPCQASSSSGGDISSLLTMNLEQLIELDVAIATGTSKPLHTAPAVATVITAEDIEAMGARTVDEALETVPGLHVSARPGGRIDPLYSIRGINTKLNPQVLLLINGLSFPFAYFGTRLSNFWLPVAAISRIEVVRGPGSAIYGADAFSGVINIITKDAADIGGTKAGARAGSFDTYDTWLQHGATYGPWRVAMSAEYLKTSGDDDRVVKADLQSKWDAVFGTDASFAPGPLLTNHEVLDTHITLSRDRWTFRGWGYFLDDGGLGAGSAQALDPVGEDEFGQMLSDLTYDHKGLFPRLDLSLRLSYLYTRLDAFARMFPPGATLPVGADGNLFTQPSTGLVTFDDGVLIKQIANDHQWGLDCITLSTGFDHHAIRYAVGLKYIAENWEDVRNYGPGVSDIGGEMVPIPEDLQVNQNATRRLGYVSLQDEWAFARQWELTAGVRYDRYSDVGGSINPRAALVWEVHPELSTKLLYGHAFRPPSFLELYSQNNPAILGNPDLDPETIDTLELVFDYKPAVNFRTALNVYGYEIRDLIQNLQVPGSTANQAQNAYNQEGYGLELEADWLVTKAFRLRGSVAWMRARDKDTGADVPDAPNMQVHVNPHWMFLPNWSLDGQFRWIADRHRMQSDPREEIDDYEVVDLTLRRKNILPNLDLALAARNLLDADVREPSDGKVPNDYPMESRAIWGELRYSF